MHQPTIKGQNRPKLITGLQFRKKLLTNYSLIKFHLIKDNLVEVVTFHPDKIFTAEPPTVPLVAELFSVNWFQPASLTRPHTASLSPPTATPGYPACHPAPPHFMHWDLRCLVNASPLPLSHPLPLCVKRMQFLSLPQWCSAWCALESTWCGATGGATPPRA